MSDTINLTFTKNSLTLDLKPVSPQELPITLVNAVPISSSPASTYVWTQSISLAVWTIPHNLGRFPSVTVVDNLNNKIEPDIQYIDNNNLQIINGVALVGKAYLN